MTHRMMRALGHITARQGQGIGVGIPVISPMWCTTVRAGASEIYRSSQMRLNEVGQDGCLPGRVTWHFTKLDVAGALYMEIYDTE